MITDLIIGIGYNVYSAILGLLPDMPERPAALDEVWRFFGWSAWILPYDQIVAFVPVLLATFGGLALWRLVRLILPGG